MSERCEARSSTGGWGYAHLGEKKGVFASSVSGSVERRWGEDKVSAPSDLRGVIAASGFGIRSSVVFLEDIANQLLPNICLGSAMAEFQKPMGLGDVSLVSSDDAEVRSIAPDAFRGGRGRSEYVHQWQVVPHPRAAAVGARMQRLVFRALRRFSGFPIKLASDKSCTWEWRRGRSSLSIQIGRGWRF